MSKEGQEKGEYYGSNEEDETMRYRDYEYNSTTVDDLIAQSSLTDFSFEAIDFDTKFRSMQTLDSTMNPFDGASLMSKNYEAQSIPSFYGSKETATATEPISFGTQKQNESNFILETIPANVPEKPFYVGPSQFFCTLSLVDLLTTLRMKLNSILEISYLFHQETCHVSSQFLSSLSLSLLTLLTVSLSLSVSQWEGVYLRGSSRCKFELYLWKDSSSYILEGNRLSVSLSLHSLL
jgi:hypothetical protein